MSLEEVYDGLESTLRTGTEHAYRFDVVATGPSGETSTSTAWVSPGGETIGRERGPTDIDPQQDPQQYVTVADGSGLYPRAERQHQRR